MGNYRNYKSSLSKEDPDRYKTGGAIQPNYDIIESYRIGKGGGSACGGKWKPSPNKPEDQRFLREPGSVKQHGYSKTTREDGWEASEKWCETADDVLEHMIGFDRLWDVITQVTVIDRTI